MLSITVKTYNQTKVFNNLSGDISWNKHNSPYIIEENIIISSGTKLTINPGVQVLFKDNSGLVFLSGSEFQVLGEQSDSVYFRPFNDSVNFFSGIILKSGIKPSNFSFNWNDLIPNYISGSLINYASFSNRSKNVIYVDSGGQKDSTIYLPNIDKRDVLYLRYKSFNTKESLAKFYNISQNSTDIIKVNDKYHLIYKNINGINSFMHGGFLKIDNDVNLLMMNSSMFNNVSLHGSAISMYPGPRFFYKCSFMSNESYVYGGAITFEEESINQWKNGSIVFNQCNFSYNKSMRYGVIAVGANRTQAYLTNIGIRLKKCMVDNNYGGAMFFMPLACDTVQIVDNVFRNNSVDFKFNNNSIVTDNFGNQIYSNKLYTNYEDEEFSLGVEGSVPVYSSCLKISVQFRCKSIIRNNIFLNNKGNNSIALTSAFKRMKTEIQNNYFQGNISSSNGFNGFLNSQYPFKYLKIAKIIVFDSDIIDTRITPIDISIKGNVFIKNQNPIYEFPEITKLDDNQFINNYSKLPPDSLGFGAELYGLFVGQNNTFTGSNSYVISNVGLGRFNSEPTKVVELKKSFWSTIDKNRLSSKILDINDDPLFNSPQFKTDTLLPNYPIFSTIENYASLINFNYLSNSKINNSHILNANLDSSLIIQVKGSKTQLDKYGIIPYKIYDSLNNIVHVGVLTSSIDDKSIYEAIIIPKLNLSINNSIDDRYFKAIDKGIYKIDVGGIFLTLVIGNVSKSLALISVDDSSCNSDNIILNANIYKADTIQLEWFYNNNPFASGVKRIKVEKSGIYKLMILDRLNNQKLDSSSIDIVEWKKVDIQGAHRLCYSDYSNKSITPIKLYIDRGFQNVSWEGISNRDTIFVNTPGKIIVQARDKFCTTKDSIDLSEPMPVYNDIRLCSINYGLVTNKYHIKINKIGSYRNIKDINIYRKISEQFVRIARLNYNDTIFTDTSSLPSQIKRSYYISITDSCSVESKPSLVHTPAILSISKGNSDSIAILNWTKYIGLSYDKIYIYKGKTNQSLKLIDSVEGQINTYTDYKLNNTDRLYVLAFKLIGDCNYFTVENVIYSEPIIAKCEGVFNSSNIIEGNNSSCFGDSIKLSFESLPGVIYNWKMNDSLINNEDYSIHVKNSGVYTLELKNASGCTIFSIPKILEFKQKLIRPLIIKNSEISLKSSYKYGNIWYFNGEVNGDTSDVIYPQLSGNYTVKAKLENCISESSDIYPFIITAINNLSLNKKIRLYPNPSLGTFILESKDNRSLIDLSVELISKNGISLIKSKLVFYKMKFDIQYIPSGTYFVIIRNKNGQILYVDSLIKL